MLHKRLRPERFIFQHILARYRESREGVIRHIDSLGAQTSTDCMVLLHLREAARNLSYKYGSLPVAEHRCDEAIALTMYPELESSVQDMVNWSASDLPNNYLPPAV